MNNSVGFAFMLVDLHQQFDILSLGEAGFQLAVVDALASNANTLDLYRSLFQQLQQSRTQLDELKARQASADKENDYHKFLFNELEEAGLKENEFEEAEIFLKRQAMPKPSKQYLPEYILISNASEQPLVQQLRSFGQQLEPYRIYHENFPEILQRLASVHIELQDIASEIESVNEDIFYDEAQIEKLNERIHTGYKLFKKHGVSTTTDLINLRDELQKKLLDSLNIAEEIHNKEKMVESLVKEATAVAQKFVGKPKGSNWLDWKKK